MCTWCVTTLVLFDFSNGYHLSAVLSVVLLWSHYDSELMVVATKLTCYIIIMYPNYPLYHHTVHAHTHGRSTDMDILGALHHTCVFLLHVHTCESRADGHGHRRCWLKFTIHMHTPQEPRGMVQHKWYCMSSRYVEVICTIGWTWGTCQCVSEFCFRVGKHVQYLNSKGEGGFIY